MDHDESRSLARPHAIQPPWRNQRQFVATLGLIGVVGLIIAALYLFQTSRSTISARELEAMTDYRARLQQEKEEKEKQVQTLTASLQRSGTVTIQPNNSLLQTLPGVNIPGVQVTTRFSTSSLTGIATTVLSLPLRLRQLLRPPPRSTTRH